MSYEIAEAVVAIGGIGFSAAQPITFKSGIQSPVYCDNRKFPFWPEQWRKVIHGLKDCIEDGGIKFDVIGGIEAAGIPHSAALGFLMSKPSVFIRKEAKGHGAKKRIEGGDVRGKRVILVEDMVTTGSSSLSAVDALRGVGAVVSDCLSILSYDMPEAKAAFAAAEVRLHAMTTFGEILPIAKAWGLVDDTGAASVEDWLRDPRGWAKRRRFA